MKKEINARFPRQIDQENAKYTIRLMEISDEAAVLDFTKSLSGHDLLFLPRDITKPKVMSAWVGEIEANNIVSLIALKNDKQVVGCSAVATDPRSFSPHVGNLRVLLSTEERAQGLGRILIQENFLLALSLGLEKLTVQMTSDQQAALKVFEGMGFKAEALLRDHVKDDAGTHHDIVILSHNVAAVEAKLELYGMGELT